jgi:hypothetical protein
MAIEREIDEMCRSSLSVERRIIVESLIEMRVACLCFGRYSFRNSRIGEIRPLIQ